MWSTMMVDSFKQPEIVSSPLTTKNILFGLRQID